MNGITFTFAIGKYGGFYAKFSSTSWRICLGWIAFTIYFLDLEEGIKKMAIDNFDYLKNERKRIDIK